MWRPDRGQTGPRPGAAGPGPEVQLPRATTSAGEQVEGLLTREESSETEREYNEWLNGLGITTAGSDRSPPRVAGAARPRPTGPGPDRAALRPEGHSPPMPQPGGRQLSPLVESSSVPSELSSGRGASGPGPGHVAVPMPMAGQPLALAASIRPGSLPSVGERPGWISTEPGPSNGEGGLGSRFSTSGLLSDTARGLSSSAPAISSPPEPHDWAAQATAGQSMWQASAQATSEPGAVVTPPAPASLPPSLYSASSPLVSPSKSDVPRTGPMPVPMLSEIGSQSSMAGLSPVPHVALHLPSGSESTFPAQAEVNGTTMPSGHPLDFRPLDLRFYDLATEKRYREMQWQRLYWAILVVYTLYSIIALYQPINNSIRGSPADVQVLAWAAIVFRVMLIGGAVWMNYHRQYMMAWSAYSCLCVTLIVTLSMLAAWLCGGLGPGRANTSGCAHYSTSYVPFVPWVLAAISPWLQLYVLGSIWQHTLLHCINMIVMTAVTVFVGFPGGANGAAGGNVVAIITVSCITAVACGWLTAKADRRYFVATSQLGVSLQAVKQQVKARRAAEARALRLQSFMDAAGQVVLDLAVVLARDVKVEDRTSTDERISGTNSSPGAVAHGHGTPSLRPASEPSPQHGALNASGSHESSKGTSDTHSRPISAASSSAGTSAVDFSYQYASAAARTLYGREPDSLKGVSMLGLVHADDVPGVLASFHAACRRAEAGPQEVPTVPWIVRFRRLRPAQPREVSRLASPGQSKGTLTHDMLGPVAPPPLRISPVMAAGFEVVWVEMVAHITFKVEGRGGDGGTEASAGPATVPRRAIVPVAVLGTERDVTNEVSARDAMEREREGRAAAAAAIDASQRSLAYAAHELRGPLFAISASLDLLRDFIPALPVEAQRDFEAVTEGAASLRYLVDDILDTTKLRSGGVLTVRHARVDVRRLLLEVCKQHESFAVVPLVVEVSPDLGRIVLTDGTRLRQCLTNGITNAAKHTFEGCIQLRATIRRLEPGAPSTSAPAIPSSGAVQLSAEPSGEQPQQAASAVVSLTATGLPAASQPSAQVTSDGSPAPSGQATVRYVLRLEVIDTGTGLGGSDPEALFKEFVQGPSAAQARVVGTGLGLPIVRKLAQLLGGTCGIAEDSRTVPKVFDGAVVKVGPHAAREMHCPALAAMYGAELGMGMGVPPTARAASAGGRGSSTSTAGAGTGRPPAHPTPTKGTQGTRGTPPKVAAGVTPGPPAIPRATWAPGPYVLTPRGYVCVQRAEGGDTVTAVTMPPDVAVRHVTVFWVEVPVDEVAPAPTPDEGAVYLLGLAPITADLVEPSSPSQPLPSRPAVTHAPAPVIPAGAATGTAAEAGSTEMMTPGGLLRSLPGLAARDVDTFSPNVASGTPVVVPQPGGPSFLSATPVPTPVPAASPPLQHGVSGIRHVLLVDDDSTNLRLTSRLLQRLGVTSVTARDGVEALELLLSGAPESLQAVAGSSSLDPTLNLDGEARAWLAASRGAWPVDAILCDVHLPRKTGDVVASQLRALGCALPILAVTGSSSREELARLRAAGYDHVLPKPFGGDQLQESIHRAAAAATATPRAGASTRRPHSGSSHGSGSGSDVAAAMAIVDTPSVHVPKPQAAGGVHKEATESTGGAGTATGSGTGEG